MDVGDGDVGDVVLVVGVGVGVGDAGVHARNIRLVMRKTDKHKQIVRTILVIP